MKKVSIIIPIFNAENYITETLKSCFEQTYPSVEIIVVDNGSTDRSYEIVAAIKKDNLFIYEQKKQGAVAARNEGLKKATGEYIMYLDADDYLPPNFIEEKMKIVDVCNDKNIIIINRIARFSTSPQEYNLFPPTIFRHYDNGIDMFINMAKNWRTTQTSGWLVSKELHLKAGYWLKNSEPNDDGEMFMRLLSVCKRVVYCDSVFSFWRDSPQSLSKEKSAKAYQSILMTYDSYRDVMLGKENSYQMKKAITRHYSNLLYNHFYENENEKRDILQRITDLGFSSPVFGGPSIIRSLDSIIGFYPTLRLINFIKSITRSNK